MVDEAWKSLECPHCGTRLEYLAVAAGTAVTCPRCQRGLELPREGVVEAEAAGEAQGLAEVDAEGRKGGESLHAADLAMGFVGNFRRPRTSWKYRLLVGLVAAVMPFPVALYLGLVGVLGWGWLWVARRGWGRVLSGSDSAVLAVGWGVVYSAVLLAGLLILYLVVRPWFARSGGRVRRLAVNPAAEPLLFSFLHMIADTVEAPRPVRVELDARLNASAGLVGGLKGFLRGDLVLTLGMPLVASLSLRELAGVIGHELGHFRQGWGLRASHLIRASNAWLARMVGDGEAWDAGLGEWSCGEAHWAGRFLWLVVRVGVECVRGLLKVPMYAGHALSSSLLRQMEFEADRCHVAMAGSADFSRSLVRLRVLRGLQRELYRDLGRSWRARGVLPDDLPKALELAEQALSAEERERWEGRAGRQVAGWFDSHPADAERIARAQAEDVPGLFRLEREASAMFGDFVVLSRQVTRLHYEEVLGLRRETFRLVPTTPGWASAAGG